MNILLVLLIFTAILGNFWLKGRCFNHTFHRSCFDVAVDCGNTNVIALLNTLTGRAEGYKVEKDWQDRQERKRERKEKKLSERGKDR